MKFLNANTSNIDKINELILKSRSIWNYSLEYFIESKSAVTIDEKYIQENLCFEIWISELVGFFAITKDPNSRFLDHLWIAKEKVNQGYGRATIDFIDSLAKSQGWNYLYVFPDPPAEGFYLKTGFNDTGKRSPSRFKGGLIFSEFIKFYK